MQTTDLPTAEEVQARFIYDPETGLFTSRSRGVVVGSISRRGYTKITIGTKRFFAHRLAWLVTHGAWPQQQVDHINGIKTDNRLCNLRLASNAENTINRKKQANNKSGYKGVHFNKKHGKYHAQITICKKCKHLGSFDTAEEASAAYQTAAKEFHGEFAKY